MRSASLLLALACALASGCSLLFDPPSGAPSDADATPGTDAAVACTNMGACPNGATQCHCGRCAREDLECPLTRLAYVSAAGETECVPGAVDVDATFAHTCAVRSDGSVWCWGRNADDQLGRADAAGRELLPVRVERDPERPPAVEVAVAIFHSCARLGDGSVECWGGDKDPGGRRGILGAGPLGADTSPTPLRVIDVKDALLGDITGLAAEGSHTCARNGSGELFCWGTNDHGEVGTGDTEPVDRATPIQTTVMPEFALGIQHTCARLETDAIVCWGRNNLGQIGNAPDCDSSTDGDFTVPQRVEVENQPDVPLEFAINVGAGSRFACATTNTATSLHCWGENDDYALGDTTDPDQCSGPEQCFGATACGARPAAFSPQGEVHEIDGGEAFTCLLAGQKVYCWGSNVSLQQGPAADSSAVYTVPGPAMPLDAATDLAVGWHHACVVTGEGKVLCWGANDQGQLGDGTLSNRAEPVEVPLCP